MMMIFASSESFSLGEEVRRVRREIPDNIDGIEVPLDELI